LINPQMTLMVNKRHKWIYPHVPGGRQGCYACLLQAGITHGLIIHQWHWWFTDRHKCFNHRWHWFYTDY